MDFNASVAILIGSVSVVAVAFTIPYVVGSGWAEKGSGRVPMWLVAAALLLATGVANYISRTPSPNRIEVAKGIGLYVVMLTGITIKWVMETVAQKRRVLHETVLALSLLVAPLAVAAGGALFNRGSAAGMILVWFLNGYFWHTLLSDIERMLYNERPIIRRVEPPYPSSAKPQSSI